MRRQLLQAQRSRSSKSSSMPNMMRQADERRTCSLRILDPKAYHSTSLKREMRAGAWPSCVISLVNGEATSSFTKKVLLFVRPSACASQHESALKRHQPLLAHL